MSEIDSRSDKDLSEKTNNHLHPLILGVHDESLLNSTSSQKIREKTKEPDFIDIPPLFHEKDHKHHLQQHESKQDSHRKGHGSDQQKHGLDRQEQTKPRERQEWTMLVDLDSNVGLDDKHQSGAHSKMEKLKQLAESTKGKSITIVAQEVVKNPDFHAPGKHDENEYLVDRYEIRDGVCTKISTKPSKGPQKDLQDLVSFGTHNYPSDKVGLIFQGHGGGARGTQGDNGTQSLSAFTEAVKEGLEGSTHSKLDFLDFDSCLMAQDSVVSRTSKIATDLVASEEVSRNYWNKAGEPIAQSEDISAPLQKLIDSTQMTGSELSDIFVKEADSGSNDGLDDTKQVLHGTDTLAHIDLKKARELEKTIDAFGGALADAMKDHRNSEAIKQIINKMPKLYEENVEYQNRDLQSFAKNIKRAIEKGEIVDSTGELGRATDNVLNAVHDVVKSFHGTQSDGPDYSKMGGISIFLPGKRFLHAKQKQSEIENTCESIEDIRNTSSGNPFTPLSKMSFADQQRTYAKELDRQYEQLMKSLSSQERKGLAGIHDAVEAVHNAKSQTELEKALDNVRDQASKLEHSKTAKEVKQKLHRKEVKERTDIYYEQEDVEANMPGMTRFWERLGDID